MTRRPKLDEMVFADYGGEWYRGKKSWSKPLNFQHFSINLNW